LKNRIIEFLKATYGIEARLSELEGYDDLNYLLRTDQDTAYVLKLSQEKNHGSLLEAQYKILRILGPLKEYQFPQAILDRNGNYFNSFENKYIARLLTYIPGKFIAEIPRNTELLRDFGRFLGTLDQTLLDHHDPVVESRHLPWDILTFPEFKNKLKYLQDANLKKLVHYFIMQYDQMVMPLFPELRKSVIHNDANDWNVLAEGNRILGIIDFGDVVYTHTINELAIACTYMAMDSQDPIDQIMPMVSGYHQNLPLNETEISVLYYLIAARLGISLIMANLSKSQDPENDYIGIHEEKATHLLEKWITIHPYLAEDRFREACGWKVKERKSHSMYRKERGRHFSKALSLSYQSPIVMEKAGFQYMYGDAGKTYVDCVNNIMHVGHAHPEVVEAGQRQMALLNTNTRYYYDALTRYAESLLQHFPEKLNKVFFVNSGSAASDLAIRLARNYTQRKDILVMEHGYHGNTTTGIEISHYKFAGKGGKGPEKYIHVAPIPDTFRGKYKANDPQAGIKYAQEIEPYLHHPIAAFICEPIIGCGGQVMLPPGYLNSVYEKVRRAGGICIADEVQTGFGRVGSHFWAFEMYHTIPDIVILGKPMGNGHPMGAVVCTDEIAAAFETGMEFFSSFGGNPVSCEIGTAVLNVVHSEGLQAHAWEMGDFLVQQLISLKSRFPLIGNVRGSGFFLGIELVSDQKALTPATIEAKLLVNKMKEHGFLLSTDGPFNQVIKFKPPLCFSRKNASDLVELLENTLESMT
jgi:4-aminobutyrate aminotransferase-like enzyme/Ser/Thr protein kinase RdoA (MazF antagonist)